MDAIELKQYIIDNNKIVDILEYLQCHHIKEHTTEYRAGLPCHSNTTALSVKKETLAARVFNSDNITKGDIFTLVMNLNNITFPESIKLIHTILGLEFKYKKTNKKEITKIDPLHIFKKVKRNKQTCNVNELEIYGEEILDDYLPYPYITWVNEGILPNTCKEFNIGYSPKHKRIIIPIRYWCGDKNDYLGIIGRTILKEYKMLDIPKYLAIKPFTRSLNLYGLQENYKHIQESGYVLVMESEKSVLKSHVYTEKTCVAVGVHEISTEQVRILISLNVDIIIAMDNDIDINFVRGLCDRFYGIRNVYYIYDKYEILGGKETKNAPVDCGYTKFKYLLKYKTKYDQAEKDVYVKWLENHQKS